VLPNYPLFDRPRTHPHRAPETLTADERLMFLALARENRHLRPSDAAMLACYCMATTKVMKLSRSKDVGPWERATRMMLALARSMRVTQQAQRDPKVVGRQNRDAERTAAMRHLLDMNDSDGEKPWQIPAADDDADAD
jgi:hypothetical protein